jgi:hypothetical protein
MGAGRSELWILDFEFWMHSKISIAHSKFSLGVRVCVFVNCMSAVDAMELVKDLPEPEALNLGRMLDDWLAGIVDRKFEAAVEAGAFDAMAAEAQREADAGKTIPLDEVLDDHRVP